MKRGALLATTSQLPTAWKAGLHPPLQKLAWSEPSGNPVDLERFVQMMRKEGYW